MSEKPSPYDLPGIRRAARKAKAAPPQPSAPWPNPETPRELVKDHEPRIDTRPLPLMGEKRKCSRCLKEFTSDSPVALICSACAPLFKPSASAEPSEPQAGQIAAERDGRGFPRNLQKEFEQRVEAAAKRAAPTGQEREESDVHDLAVRLAGWLGYGGYITDHFEKTINEWLTGRTAPPASGKEGK